MTKKESVKKTRRYGWKPDIPDMRDWKYAKTHKKQDKTELPIKVDLREGKKISPVEDQSSIGSCVANSLVGAVEYLELKSGVKYKDLSRLFLYYNVRVIEGTANEDSGAYIRDAVKSLAKSGVCEESIWPYDITQFRKKPSKECYTAALNNTISEYSRIESLNDLKTSIAAGYPVAFGFSVYESFESNEVAKTGVVPMPESNESLLGGHAVLAVGYDDTKNCIIVKNSWGISWGDKGYFYLPYGFVTDSNLSSDYWTIRKAKNF